MTPFGRREPRGTALDWDDGDAAAFVAELATLLQAGDVAADDALALGTRSTVLSQFALVPRRGSWSAAVRPRRGRPRAAWGLIAAGVLGLAAVGGVVASAPGRPLYEARIATETIALPDDPVARERAQAGRLTARVQDAEGAAAAGDPAGVRAGLDAFARIAAEATAAAVPDEASASRTAEVLARIAQISVDGSEGTASLARARQAGAALLDALRGPGTQPGTSGGGGPVARPTTSPSPAMTPRGDGNGGGSQGPSATAGPRRTPAPTRGGTGGGSSGPSRGAGSSPSPTTKAPTGSGGGSGSDHGGSDGGSGPGSGSGSGSGGSGGGPGGPNP